MVAVMDALLTAVVVAACLGFAIRWLASHDAELVRTKTKLAQVAREAALHAEANQRELAEMVAAAEQVNAKLKERTELLQALHAEPSVLSPESTSLAERIEALGADERAILELLLSRLEMGRKQYGEWNVNDGRDYADEAMQEALDGLHYVAAALVRARKHG